MKFIKDNWQWFVGGVVVIVIFLLFARKPAAAPAADTATQNPGTTPLFIAGTATGGGGSFDESGSFDVAAALEDIIGDFGSGGGGVDSDAVQIARINAEVQQSAIAASTAAFNNTTGVSRSNNLPQGSGGAPGQPITNFSDGKVTGLGVFSGFSPTRARSQSRNVADLRSISSRGVTLNDEFAVFDSIRSQGLSLTKAAETLNRANFGGSSTHSVASLQAFIQSKGLPSIKIQ